MGYQEPDRNIPYKGRPHMGITARTYIPLFRHQPGTTPVHRCPAGIKVLVLMTLTVLVFSGNRPLLAGASVFVLAAALVARLSAGSLMRLFRIMLFYGLFIALVRITGKARSTWLHELQETAVYLWKLATVFTAGMVFFESTTAVAIHTLLSRIRTTCTRILHISLPDFPRAFSLMLLFIPRIFDTWTGLSRAWDARGGNLGKSLPGGIRKLVTLVPLLIISLLDVAATTDRAVRNRS